MCVKHIELKFQQNAGINTELKGTEFYKLIDANRQTDLQVSWELGVEILMRDASYFFLSSFQLRR